MNEKVGFTESFFMYRRSMPSSPPSLSALIRGVMPVPMSTMLARSSTGRSSRYLQ